MFFEIVFINGCFSSRKMLISTGGVFIHLNEKVINKTTVDNSITI